MVIQGLQFILFFGLCLVLLAPGFDLLYRVLYALILISVNQFLLHNGKKNPPFLAWLSSEKQTITSNALGFSFLILTLFLFLNLNRPGLLLQWIHPSTNEALSFRLDLEQLEITPPQFPEPFHHMQHYQLRISCSFFLDEPALKMGYYLSHGEGIWLIDGVEQARHFADSPERSLANFSLLEPGFHSLECYITANTLLPSLSITQAQHPDGALFSLAGPFHSRTIHQSSTSSRIIDALPWACFILGFLFLIPLLNGSLAYLNFIIREHPRAALPAMLLLGFSVYLIIRIQIYPFLSNQYEADEAAFGIMAINLLQGQAPPLFHYGQDYQGTLEAFPLAASFLNSQPGAAAMHHLPIFWGLLFLVITTLTFWFFGSLHMAVFSLFILAIGGSHLHWIISKTWFGYSFSLTCGASLWFLAFYAHRRGFLSPGLALLWSLIAALGFYSLPITFPFILFSGFILVGLPSPYPREITKIWNRHFYKNIGEVFQLAFMHLARNGSLLALILFAFFLFPYYLGAYEYLVEGRVLPPPRTLDEHPLFDRFLRECLPVLLGLRAPFDQSHNLRNVWLPSFPPTLFLLALLLFPWLSSSLQKKYALLRQSHFRFLIWLFALTTILLVSYSSFGVWPWYAIPLYWVMPILLFVLCRFLYAYSPAVAFAVLFIYLVSLLSGLTSYSTFFHQPLSLSAIGFRLPVDFKGMESVLRQFDVRHLLCDQGYDIGDYGGRDWVGECIVFDSAGRIAAVDRLSRRIPAVAQEIIQADRVAYLFHKDFYFNNARSGEYQQYKPLNMQIIDKMFNELLGFQRFFFDPYYLFIPPLEYHGDPKHLWTLESSYPYFLAAAADHNISTRISGSETFWSSNQIPEEGAWLQISLPKSKEFQRIVLYHGTKISDVPDVNEVFIRNESGDMHKIGNLTYDSESHCSFLILENKIHSDFIHIRVQNINKDRWWTIYELWVL